MRLTQPVLSALALYETYAPLPRELRGRRGRGLFLAALAAADALGLEPPIVTGPDQTQFEWADEGVLRAMLRSGIFEPETVALLRAVTPVGGVVLDVGANVGYLTALASRWVGRHGHVYAFEPVAATRQRLLRNLMLNACTNVTVLDAACGAAVSLARMRSRPDSGWSRIETRPGQGEPVTVTTLDAIVERYQLRRVDVLKIDTEGYDFAVLLGAEDTVARFRPVIHMEVEHVNEFGSSPAEARALLESWGYTVREIANHGSVDFYAVP